MARQVNPKDVNVKRWFKHPIVIAVLLVVVVGIIIGIIANRGNSDNASNGNNNVSPTPSTTPYYATADPAKFSAEQLFSVISGSRIATGIVSLQEDASLDGAANIRAYQIQQNGTSTGGGSSSIFTRVSNAVPATTYADEISQGVCDNATSNSTFASLVGNASVDQSLNDPKYTVAGVGLQKSDPGKCNGYVVIELSDIN